MKPISYDEERLFDASQVLRSSTEPLDRLAGEFCELTPYNNLSARSILGRETLRSLTIWKNVDIATSTEQMVNRELKLGNSLDDLAFNIGIQGLYKHAFVQLSLTRHRGKTQLRQPEVDVEYHNPLPYQADAFKASRHFINEITDRHLRT